MALFYSSETNKNVISKLYLRYKTISPYGRGFRNSSYQIGYVSHVAVGWVFTNEDVLCSIRPYIHLRKIIGFLVVVPVVGFVVRR